MMNKDTEKVKKEPLEEKPKKAEKPLKEKMIKIKESEQARLIEEAAKYKEQYIRLYAEFENARKRMGREKQEFVKFANEGLITEFLGILDNLERSVEAAKAKHQDYTAFLKGIELVMAHVHEMLKNNGVVPVESQGKMFDPHCHEVLMQEETEEMEDGMVMEEFQKGYRLGEKVIRTAKVKVARKK
ncbi:MAG: nucleotide exchange factor GrpE [Candidatus Omnitrophica bacterium]|nr:nucleotide exchange factor GrpE [Candidatus Omnitrophota bacterium]